MGDGSKAAAATMVWSFVAICLAIIADPTLGSQKQPHPQGAGVPDVCRPQQNKLILGRAGDMDMKARSLTSQAGHKTSHVAGMLQSSAVTSCVTV